MTPEARLKATNDYFVAIETIDGSQVIGAKLGAATEQVLSLITGSLYDRGGTYQGRYSAFAQTVDNNLNIQSGFLDVIYTLLKNTWGSDLRQATKNRISALTKDVYDTLLAEKKQIVYTATYRKV